MLLSSFVLLEEDFLQVPIEDETLVAHRLSVESITFQKYTWPSWLSFLMDSFCKLTKFLCHFKIV